MRLFAILLLCLGTAQAWAVQDFEAGLGAWSVEGLWHHSSGAACFNPHSGSACLYFGRDTQCNYDNGSLKDHRATGGAVYVSDPARAVMSFWLYSSVESLDPACYDQLWLEITDDGGATWAPRDLSPGVSPAGGSPGVGWSSGSGLAGAPLWVYQRIDLSVYLGLTITARFRFLSAAKMAGDNSCGPADADFDNFLGYAIDDIAIHEEPQPVVLNKSASPGVLAAGSTLTYVLSWRNVGPGPATVSIWDCLPASLTFVSSMPPVLPVAGRVDFTIPAVASGASGAVTVLASTGPAPSDIFNLASASSSASAGVFDSALALAKVRSPGLYLTKSVSPGNVTVGDRITFTLVLENNSAAVKSPLTLEEYLPSGFVLLGAYPGFNRASGWDLGSLGPGQVRTFTLWGLAYGEDGQVITNVAQALVGGAAEASASASYSVTRPLEPTITLKGIYPNPAPSGKPGLPQSAFVYYELNQAMPIKLDIFTVAGDKVRSLDGSGERGPHQIEWDLKNSWGAEVASGVYLLRVWSSFDILPQPEAVGYVAVIR